MTGKKQTSHLTGICDGATDPRGLYYVIRKDRVSCKSNKVIALKYHISQ